MPRSDLDHRRRVTPEASLSTGCPLHRTTSAPPPPPTAGVLDRFEELIRDTGAEPRDMPHQRWRTGGLLNTLLQTNDRQQQANTISIICDAVQNIIANQPYAPPRAPPALPPPPKHPKDALLPYCGVHYLNLYLLYCLSVCFPSPFHTYPNPHSLSRPHPPPPNTQHRSPKAQFLWPLGNSDVTIPIFLIPRPRPPLCNESIALCQNHTRCGLRNFWGWEWYSRGTVMPLVAPSFSM